jgi:hypothetical protein
MTKRITTTFSMIALMWGSASLVNAEVATPAAPAIQKAPASSMPAPVPPRRGPANMPPPPGPYSPVNPDMKAPMQGQGPAPRQPRMADQRPPRPGYMPQRGPGPAAAPWAQGPSGAPGDTSQAPRPMQPQGPAYGPGGPQQGSEWTPMARPEFRPFQGPDVSPGPYGRYPMPSYGYPRAPRAPHAYQYPKAPGLYGYPQDQGYGPTPESEWAPAPSPGQMGMPR